MSNDPASGVVTVTVNPPQEWVERFVRFETKLDMALDAHKKHGEEIEEIKADHKNTRDDLTGLDKAFHVATARLQVLERLFTIIVVPILVALALAGIASLFGIQL